MCERVLDIEVVWIVEDGHDVSVGSSSTISGSVTTVWRDGDAVEWNWRVCDFGHDGK